MTFKKAQFYSSCSFSSVKKGTAASFFRDISYFLESYATDDIVAETDSEKMRFTQTSQKEMKKGKRKTKKRKIVTKIICKQKESSKGNTKRRSSFKSCEIDCEAKRIINFMYQSLINVL